MASHWAANSQEEEDLALALALSLSEVQGPPQHSSSHNSQPSPAAAQRSAPPAPAPRPSAAATAAPHRPPVRPVAAPQPAPRQQPQPPPSQQQPSHTVQQDSSGCPGCGKSIPWGSQHVVALERKWHAACLRCGLCNEQLLTRTATQFAQGADGKLYHMDCHKHKFHPVCSICDNFIATRPDGRIEFKELPFWRQKYCAHHGVDTQQCCSCSRFRPLSEDQWVVLNDKRDLCLECVSSIVVDTKDAQPLYEEILSFYRSMGMEHSHRAPMMLVDSHTLNEYSNKEGRDTSSGGPIFHVRGLTLATVYRSIPSIVRRVGGHGVQVSSVSTPLLDQATTTCSVSGVLVMYGLPRLLTGCILAHELMHAWLRMRNVVGLDAQVEEGLCQLMAMLWLDQQHDKLNDDAMQQRLASYFAFQIREDTSEVYGDGFRIAYDEFQRQGGGMRGLSSVISNVLTKGRLTA